MMGFRHNIAKSLIWLIVREPNDIEYREIAESYMADSTTFDAVDRNWAKK